MKSKARPIRTTISLGLISGLSFIPLTLALSYVLPWTRGLCVTIWIYVAVYGLLLARWSGKPILSAVYPLLLLFLAVFLVNSSGGFMLFALGILGWIRSGICFGQPFGRKLATEIVLSLGVIALVALLSPATAFSWALGVWMFFLIQALYFVFLVNISETEKEIETDPFEHARLQIERILSSG